MKKIWKISRADGAPINVWTGSVDFAETPYARPVKLKIWTDDDGAAYMQVEAPTEDLCDREELGQISDGFFENVRFSKVELVRQEA